MFPAVARHGMHRFCVADSALSMAFNGAMLTNKNVLASLRTLADWKVGAVGLVEGPQFCVALAA